MNKDRDDLGILGDDYINNLDEELKALDSSLSDGDGLIDNPSVYPDDRSASTQNISSEWQNRVQSGAYPSHRDGYSQNAGSSHSGYRQNDVSQFYGYPNTNASQYDTPPQAAPLQPVGTTEADQTPRQGNDNEGRGSDNNTPKKPFNKFAYLIKNNVVRTLVVFAFTLISIFLFFGALSKAYDAEIDSFLIIAFRFELDTPFGMIPFITVLMFAVFVLLSIGSLVKCIKRPTAVALISAAKIPLLISAAIMTASVAEYYKTSTLLYGLAIVFELLAAVVGVLYLVFDDSVDRKSLTDRGKIRSIVILAFSLLAEVTIFFVPIFYYYDAEAEKYHFEQMINVFSVDNFNLFSSVCFIIFFLLFILGVVLAINHFRYLSQDNDLFNKKLKSVVYYSSILSIVFFVMSVVITFYYNSTDIHPDSATLGYIPFILSIGMLLIDAVFNGKYREITKRVTRKGVRMRAVMLLFIFLMTAMTIVSLFSNIMIATFEEPVNQVVRINGFSILLDYQSYGESYQALAFLFMGMICCVLLALILSWLSFFRDSKMFKSMFILSITINFLFVAAMFAFGKYYEIVQKANIEHIKDLAQSMGFDVNAKCTVTSDVLYYFLIDVGVLVAMFLVKPYTKYVIEENEVTEIAIAEGSNIGIDPAMSSTGAAVEASKASADAASSTEASTQPTQDTTAPQSDAQASSAGSEKQESQSLDIPSQEGLGALAETLAQLVNPRSKAAALAIDQCPPFTFLDERIEYFKEDLNERRQYTFNNVTLKSLVNFVVDYAKNSRLHLSYTPKDIATFVAGLGVGRLSILQGMSGTGKTSLPKIFAEAILGNCEIVEVESSWKDKNELLGYYNEFSKLYTPKKFTQDLYKASLNPNIFTFIVLDEMNLSRIEYYFSDFLSLMENEEDKREIKLVNIKIANYENERRSYSQLIDDMVLKIPKNVWFIGTANRDESTFEISDKVYDRASTMNFNKRAPKITQYGEPLEQRFVDAEVFRQLIQNAIQNVRFDISEAKQIAGAEALLAPYNLSFGNRIERQIESFVKIYAACFESRNVIDEAIETIFLSKVVAKLEFKTVDDKAGLANGFEELGLRRCAEFIRKLNEDI